MQSAALIMVIAAGLWLALVGGLMALRPGLCVGIFERMTVNLEASSWRQNVIEQGARIVAGAALVVRAPASRLPIAFEVAGWILVATSVAIALSPPRWHGAYGRWWMGRITPLPIRLLSPVPMMAGAGLIYAAL
jgi:hypothetical protein